MKGLFYAILGMQLVGNLYGSNGTITVTLACSRDVCLSPLMNFAKETGLKVEFRDPSKGDLSSSSVSTFFPISSGKRPIVEDSVAKKIDRLNNDYYGLDILKAGEVDSFLRGFSDDSSFKSIPEQSRSYLIKNLKAIAHDALVNSEEAFIEYKGSGKDIIEKVETGYKRINTEIMHLLKELESKKP